MELQYTKEVTETFSLLDLDDLLEIVSTQQCTYFEYPTYDLPWQKFYVDSIIHERVFIELDKEVHIYNCNYKAINDYVLYKTLFARIENKYFPVYYENFNYIVKYDGGIYKFFKHHDY